MRVPAHLRFSAFRASINKKMARVFAISDLHVDYKENLTFVNSWSPTKYQDDALIVAGDVTDKLALLETTLKSFKTKFRDVFYISGNHELWIRPGDSSGDSYSKFYCIQRLCTKLGVHITPQKFTLDPVTEGQGSAVWIVPLHSWYAKPEEDSFDSLYIKPSAHIKEDVKHFEDLWMDNHLCKWPGMPMGDSIATSFTDMNKHVVTAKYDAPIISFSHFLPRKDLVKSDERDQEEIAKVRKRNDLGEAPKFQGGVPGFNFTRYAGCVTLETQIRQLGSVVHVFGHQHRNRDRVVDGIRYVSHCLGQPREQKEGWVWGVDDWKGPKQIWPLE